MNISMSNSFEHVAYINFYIFTLRRNRRQSLFHDSKCLFSLIFFRHKLSKQSFDFIFGLSHTNNQSITHLK